MLTVERNKMPTYTFRNKETGETYTDIMTYDQKLKFLENNPVAESVIVAPNIVRDANYGNLNHTPEFREVLQKVKQAHPKTTVDTGNLSEV